MISSNNNQDCRANRSEAAIQIEGNSTTSSAASASDSQTSRLPDADVEPVIEALQAINSKLAELDKLWEGVARDAGNLMKFIAPERRSIVLERLEEVGGVPAGVANMIFEALTARLDKVSSVTSEAIDVDWSKIDAVRSRWLWLLNTHQAAAAYHHSSTATATAATDASFNLSVQLSVLEPRLSSVLKLMSQIESRLATMQQCSVRVRSLIDATFVSCLKDLESVCATTRIDAKLCCQDLQDLCSVLDDLISSWANNLI